ncbi:uncharacterized protein LOC116023370 [Ipomoea triloba]|uniref:uncharacterized protein LOC116023370 n=1 Tax=Ipomoea triloba TaxID=35885 RepID=UPI00125DBE4D|nr:uncharacterized protein LOC116023370 [Ipomoea triloba]
MKVITWNCQGAAFKNFIRAAKWILNKHHPDIFYLVETKTSGSNADSVCIKLGFEKWARVEALRFSGGIWFLWSNACQIEVLNSHPQFVHMVIKENTGRVWNLSVVYGSLAPHLRRRLWKSLCRGKVVVNHPWLIAGDFNAITSNDECTSYNSSGTYRNGDFRNWIFDEALVDLSYSGQKYTWKRGREEDTFTGARLDRALCSMDWMDLTRDTKVTHLPAVSSDHCPILIELDPKTSKEKNNFVFQGAWTRHPPFLDYITKHWNVGDTVWNNKDADNSCVHRVKWYLGVLSDAMALKLKAWNANVFGNIHYRKNKILRHLEGVQKKLDAGNHSRLIKLEKKLRNELKETLCQEEILWYQQSREE